MLEQHTPNELLSLLPYLTAPELDKLDLVLKAESLVESRETAEKRLIEFSKSIWHVVEPNTLYVHGWHLEAICEYLEACKLGQIHNLLINVPPRHMKSLAVSVFFPAWVWATSPGTRFLYSSYSQGLATRDSLKTRRVIESLWYQARWAGVFRLTTDQNTKTRFENNKTGYRIATSVGGSATGEGGDYVVVDDPHNIKEQESELKREAVIDWWDGVMSTRLNNLKEGCRIIIMQRCHTNDLAGHVLSQGGYEHLCLPSEYEETSHSMSIPRYVDPRLEDGELLWPERFGEAEIADQKMRLGSFNYAAQHQQRPTPREGGLARRDWWRYWNGNLPTEFDEVIQSWDLSFKDTKDSAYVAGGVWARKGADKYLLHQVRRKMDFVATLKAIEVTSNQWPQAAAKLVEDKANGPAVISTLRSRISGLIPVEPQGSKEARASAVTPEIESGNVYLPDPKMPGFGWVNDYVKEWADAPFGDYWDQIDQTSQALMRFRRPKGFLF